MLICVSFRQHPLPKRKLVRVLCEGFRELMEYFIFPFCDMLEFCFSEHISPLLWKTFDFISRHPF